MAKGKKIIMKKKEGCDYNKLIIQRLCFVTIAPPPFININYETT